MCPRVSDGDRVRPRTASCRTRCIQAALHCPSRHTCKANKTALHTRERLFVQNAYAVQLRLLYVSSGGTPLIPRSGQGDSAMFLIRELHSRVTWRKKMACPLGTGKRNSLLLLMHPKTPPKVPIGCDTLSAALANDDNSSSRGLIAASPIRIGRDVYLRNSTRSDAHAFCHR